MQRHQIALQLYTLREHCRDRDMLSATCGRVAAIGYRALQISGINRKLIPEDEIRSICAEHGLTICATHESDQEIRHHPTRVVERLRALGCSLTAYPCPNQVDFGSESDVSALIRDLEQAGRILADAGITLAYHNHHFEFRRLGGQRIIDRIYAETDPRHLQGEPDIYWIQYGGGDPVAWCRRLAHRLPLIHLKDYRISASNQIEFAEVGQGNLDIPAIIHAAEAAGCRWFVVEQDTCTGDPFASIAQSFDYLAGLASGA